MDLRIHKWHVILPASSNRSAFTSVSLHVDNFDRLPYSRRHQRRRRLCLTLAPARDAYSSATTTSSRSAARSTPHRAVTTLRVPLVIKVTAQAHQSSPSMPWWAIKVSAFTQVKALVTLVARRCSIVGRC
jgi:hypothetical protein